MNNQPLSREPLDWNSSSVSPKIAIVGSGAVGCYYGGLLARSGRDVCLLMRSDYEAVSANGLIIKTRGETLTVRPKIFRTAKEIGPCDMVIIALKATANPVMEQIIPDLLQEHTALVTLQNGLGNEEFLADRWGKDRVMGGLCFVCLNRTAPGVIEHFDHGALSIGEYRRGPQERTQWLVSAFQRAGIETKLVESLIEERWRKLLWNIPFNGLSIAANGATVADVLADEGLRSLARDLMSETLEAARLNGCEIPESFADFQIERSWSMGAYKPSSMIDWELGRAIEVEAIWGKPLRQGLKAGAEMSRLETIYRLVQYAARPMVK